jgi:ATP-binding cassette, subfamily B, bacterial
MASVSKALVGQRWGDETRPEGLVGEGFNLRGVMWHMNDADAVKGKKLDRGLLRRAWVFARPFKTMIAWFLATMIIGSVLGIIPSLLFKKIIDDAIVHSNRRMVSWIAVAMLAAALISGGLTLVSRWCSSRVGEGLIYELRTALFDKVQRMPIAFFTRTQTGALISRLNNDVVGAQRAVTGTLGQVVSNTITLVVSATAMFYLSWKLTLLSLVILPIFVIPAKRVGRKLAGIFREQMNLNAQMNTQMTERFNVSGAQLVKLYGRVTDEREVFSSKASAVRDTGVRGAMYGRTFAVGLDLAQAVGAAAIYVVGANLVISHSLKVGTLVAMAGLVMRVYNPLTELTSARIDIMTAMVSFERVFEMLDAPMNIVDKPNAIALSKPTGRVELDHVTFRYPAATEVSVASLERPGASELSSDQNVDVLHDISLMIEPGQMVALVGPSGAGKSTIAALLPRLYDVTSGAIRIDGHDIRDLTMQSVADAIGVVPQDPHLFHESIADNLRYAKTNATLAEMEKACRAAQIHQVIDALPEGYDTVVGERGYRLSGGEKQRLAIARMLLKNPAVVILDEATSHLDSENEALVQAALEAALTDRTSIVIAHRLSTVRNADVICVLENGRIVQRGTHDALLASGGLYSELYRTLTGEATPVAGS